MGGTPGSLVQGYGKTKGGKSRLPKCPFVRKLEEFLGHVLMPKGLHPNPGKETAVNCFQPHTMCLNHVNF